MHYGHAQLNQAMGRPLSRSVPRGGGRPVVVAPGLGCNHLATGMMRSELGAHGYTVKDWGGGTNVGPARGGIEAWLAPMLARIHLLHAQTGQKVALIGWSLGGIAARELSRIPGVPVDRVITLGCPFSDMNATNVGSVYRLLNDEPSWASPDVARALASEPAVAGTSIFSKTDGLVHWEACVQPQARHTRNVEVSGASHFGMVLCPKVLRTVLEELAH